MSKSPSTVILPTRPFRQQPPTHRLGHAPGYHNRPAEQGLAADLVDILSSPPAAAGSSELELPQRNVDWGVMVSMGHSDA